LLDILLLVLQIVTLILLFLFIWWVVRSARRDLMRSAEGVRMPAEQQALSWEYQSAALPAQASGEAFAAQWPEAGVAPTAQARSERTREAPSATDELPYGAAVAPTVAVQGVSLDQHDLDVSGRDDIEARREARVSQSSAAVDGLDMTAVVRPRLVVESSLVLPTGQEIVLEGWLGIGRSSGSDLVLNDHFVSSTHARVVRRGQYFFVEDLGSTNGTYVNERRVTEAQLRLDTRLRIGETVFRYEE
jgi:hypothetical protein